MRLETRARLGFNRGVVILFIAAELLAAAWAGASEPPSLDERAAALQAIREAGGNAWPDVDKLRARGESKDLSHVENPLKLVRFRAKNRPIADETLAALAAFPELEELDLSSSGITDDQLAKLPLPNLEALDLSKTPVTDAGLEHLRALTKLQALNLSGTAVIGHGLNALKALKDLQSVNLNETPVTDTGVACLAHFPNLSTVALKNTDVGDAALEHLCDNIKVKQLWLAHSQVSDSGLAALERMTDLSGLLLGETRVGDAGIEAIAHLRRLATLSLAATRVTDRSASKIAQWNDLTWLDLSQTGFTELGVKQLRGLKNLVSLRLRGVRLSDASLRALANMDKLEILDLADTPVTDAGLAYLAPLTSLRWLDLSGTKVRGPGLKNLLNLPRLSSVEVARTEAGSFHLNAITVRAALNAKTELDFASQPLSDVIEYLTQKYDIPVRLEYRSMTAAGIASDTPITCNLKGVPLAEALKTMLDPLGLAFAVRHEVLLVAAKPLAQPAPDFPLVPPGQRLSPKLAEAMKRASDLDFGGPPMPLKDFVAKLSKRHNIDIELDVQSLTAAGIGFDTPVSRWMKGITLKSALELTLSELGLVCVADGEKVVIRAVKAP